MFFLQFCYVKPLYIKTDKISASVKKLVKQIHHAQRIKVAKIDKTINLSVLRYIVMLRATLFRLHLGALISAILINLQSKHRRKRHINIEQICHYGKWNRSFQPSANFPQSSPTAIRSRRRSDVSESSQTRWPRQPIRLEVSFVLKVTLSRTPISIRIPPQYATTFHNMIGIVSARY